MLRRRRLVLLLLLLLLVLLLLLRRKLRRGVRVQRRPFSRRGHVFQLSCCCWRHDHFRRVGESARGVPAHGCRGPRRNEKRMRVHNTLLSAPFQMTGAQEGRARSIGAKAAADSSASARATDARSQGMLGMMITFVMGVH
jgi:hypothetical protein